MRTAAGICLAILLTLSLVQSLSADEVTGLGLQAAQKKVIAIGGELSGVTPRDFPEIVKGMADSPFDGLCLDFNASPNSAGVECSINTAYRKPRWRKEWLTDDLRILKNARTGKLTDNFFRINISPANFGSKNPAERIPWTDDEWWGSFANNMGVMAWFVKEAGFKGIVFDPEDYAKPRVDQYFWMPSDGDYQATCRLARKRGAQLASAMTKEYPDITLFFFWFMSLRNTQLQATNPDISLAQGRDLWVPFINGILDGIGPKVKVVDAFEETYTAQGSDFMRAYHMIKNRSRNLVAPENYRKYTDQVSIAHALYINMNTHPEGEWYFPPLNGSRTARFLSTLSDALASTDEYVWIWHESGKWRNWNLKSGRDLSKVRLWEEQLPGAEDAIRLAKDPSGQARNEIDRLKAEGSLVNLINNPGFGDAPAAKSQNATGPDWSNSGAPADWFVWQSSDSHGTFTVDKVVQIDSNFSAKSTGVVLGCYLQTIPVKPGEWYAVEALARKSGGSTQITVGWMSADGVWLNPLTRSQFFFQEKVGEWQRGTGAVKVPEGADKLVFQLGMTHQGDGESAWFSNPAIYKLR